MSVTFSNENIIHNIPNRYGKNKSMGFVNIKNLMLLSEDAEINIIKCLNDYCKTGCIILSNNDSIKILDNTKYWYEDNSMVLIWEKIKNNVMFYKYFCQQFNNSINRYIKLNFEKFKQYNKSYISNIKYQIKLDGQNIIIEFPKVMIKKIKMTIQK